MGSLGIGPMKPGAIGGGQAAATTLRRDVAVAGRPDGQDLRPLLERDGVLIVDTVPFQLSDGELELIDSHWSDGRSKNSSYNPQTDELDGVIGAAEAVA